MSFTADDLIDCYRRGVFPMAETRGDASFYLVDPARRGVLPLKGFHVPRRLARTVRADPYEVRVDSAFAEVVTACAQPSAGRTETWINRPIERLYSELFRRGRAHSVECWEGGKLAGGLYGVSIGAAFFGESMFSTARDASKVALVHLVARLIVGGYRLLDTQFINDHLTQFGVEEIARETYQERLGAALEAEGDFYALGARGVAGAGAARGTVALQAISQAS
jgi:leucyl/phenylalanyl-tRNA--protein transferase